MTQPDLLKPLVDAIETVKGRISKHRSELSGHEYRTRMSLIDPLLRALGWDVSDPAVVGVEYETTSRGRPDYALNHSEIRRGVVVEAKSLGTRLEEREVDQVTTYANRLGAPFAALTDGNRWVAYNMRDVSPLPERKVLDISLSDISPHAAALKLLLFWRPNIESGQPQEAERPIAGLPGTETVTTPPPLSASPAVSTSVEQERRSPEDMEPAIKERQREAGRKAAETRQRNMSGGERDERDKAIYADRQSGMTYREIAKKYGFSENGGGVHAIVKKMRQAAGE